MASKHILFLHGAGPKPDEADLAGLCRSALETGLERDFGSRLDNVAFETFYYADQIARADAEAYDSTVDLHNRKATLDALSKLDKTKSFRRKFYEDLPGKSSRREFMMDVTASLGLSGMGFKKFAPDLHAYLKSDGVWAEQLTGRIVTWLEATLAEHDRVLLISHCMGNALAYNALWHLSHGLDSPFGHHLDQWLTLGSPLAANYVRKRLYGATAAPAQRYPTNVLTWHNIAAEDDYMCHDMTVADDFKAMLTTRVTSAIEDHTIYNLSVRYGASDPHHSAGYLVHPRTALIINEWLQS